jgi:hypothetical protein
VRLPTRSAGELEPEQDALLGEIIGGELVTVADLELAGVLPVVPIRRPVAEKPAKQGQLG